MLKNNKKKFNNRGFYIEYSLIDSQLSYEYINEVSFIVRNIDRSQSKINNMFEWINIIDNKIKNLIYIYIHIVSIPLTPYIDKTPCTFYPDFITFLLANNQVNTIYMFNDIVYQVAFINDSIIDFISDLVTYSFNRLDNTFYMYKTSNKSMLTEPFIYLNVDSNDNLSNNACYNTSKLTNNFSYKLVPILNNNNYIYFKAIKQYIIKKVNTVQSINNLNISLSDSTNKKLINQHINKYMYNQTYLKCDCIDNIRLASCYCTYIRHPFHVDSQIDIGFKIGQIQNELINNIFH